MCNRAFRHLTVLLFFASFACSTAVRALDKPEMLYFYSEDCEHCKAVKKEFLPGFLEKYGSVIDFKEFDVNKPGVLDSLYVMEDRVGVPESDKDYPAVYFLGVMVEGEIPVRMRLESIVETYLASPEPMLELDREVRARVPEKVEPTVTEAKASVSMLYFYKQGCKECSRAKEIIGWLGVNYPFITVDSYDINEKGMKTLAAWMGMKTGVPEKKLMSTPVIFIGSDYCLEEDISRRRLSNLIESYTSKGAAPVWRSVTKEELAETEKQITSLFGQFTLLAVALAGLADGINPCAFATILFFVSYLGMVGRKGREILFVGLAFAFAVFLTYFLVGLGFFNIVRKAAHIDFLAKIIFGGTGALCIVFGFMSIGDYFKAKKGKVSDMSLQLPKFLKKRIHDTIRKKAKMKSYIFGALFAGFLVSILEFACTGQVYLPTITLVVKQEGLGSLAVFYLFLYNIFFIVPLLVVFGFVYFGVSSQGIAKIMEKRVGAVKLGLAAVFFTVGVLLFWAVF